MVDQRAAALDEYIKAEGDRFVVELQELVRQVSDSSTGEGFAACSELLAARAQASGLQAKILKTEGNPLVFGEWEQRPGLPTLLITSHYDVQPVEPLSAWQRPPYGAQLEGDHLWGRGTSDAKGPVMAILKAAESVVRATGRPAVNLKVVFDGEEEIGSPSYPKAVKQYRDLLKADAVVTFDGNSAADGRPQVTFGSGGLLYLTLEAETGRNDIHANRGALVPNALWRLVWALSTLKTSEENITIDGFDEQLMPITESDRSLLATNPAWNDEKELKSLGTKGFLPGRGGEHGHESLHLLPILGIAGLHGGCQGDGVFATLPARAKASMYIGLRYNQDPDDIFQKIRAHLDRRGFGDIKLTQLGSTEPAFCDPESPFGVLLRKQLEEFAGRQPLVTPRSYGYGRQAQWLANRLDSEGAMVWMVAPPQPNNHGPNEYILLDYYFRAVQFIGRFILACEGLPDRK